MTTSVSQRSGAVSVQSVVSLAACLLFAGYTGCSGEVLGRDVTDVDKFLHDMVTIEAKKEFVVGDEEHLPTRTVAVESFAISPFEIPQGLYFRVMNEKPSAGPYLPLHPVQNLSWYDAAKFCNALSKLAGLEPCYDMNDAYELDISRNGFRLPSSAQWELACRGDHTTTYFWGEAFDSSFCVEPLTQKELNKIDPTKVSYSQPVGTKKPNDTGLYDMAGNVSEWCQDSFAMDVNTKVIRGGSWENVDKLCFAAKWRTGMKIENRLPSVGFRVVRSR